MTNLLEIMVDENDKSIEDREYLILILILFYFIKK